MLTQPRLRDRLKEFGIVRTSRALTSWREKGLLPSLRKKSLGRGGSQWFWDDEAVLEQAVAVDCLLKKRARSSDALLALWWSGYPIDAKQAHAAWIRHLESQREEVEKQAPRFTDGHLGIGKSLWRASGKQPWARDFVVPLIEAAFDDRARDDADFRANIASLLTDIERSGLPRTEVHGLIAAVISEGWLAGDTTADSTDNSSERVRAVIERVIGLIHSAVDAVSDGTASDDIFRFVERIWTRWKLETLLINRESIEQVRSMTLTELEHARQGLAVVGNTMKRCIEVSAGGGDKRLNTCVLLALMVSLGPFLATMLTTGRRQFPDWPLTRTISAIHDFVLGVQSNDVTRGSNNNYHASERVITEWLTTRHELSRLWSTVTYKTT